jgi:DNA processing protein
MASLKYWLWLATRRNFAGAAQRKILEYFGTPEDAFYADLREYELAGLSPAERAALEDRDLTRPEQILEACERLRIRIITLRDAEYPNRLKHIYNPPSLLYVKGRFPDFDEEVAVAVVGSRGCSAYGQLCAQRLSYQIASCGALVLSGLARGIDTAAITGALKAGGQVAAVLGGGIDVVYPRENRFLFEDVAAAGALISEYPPGTEPRSAHFPVRNRIISGLSSGVLVIEAARRSGALITADHALEQGRDVFAVPGNIDAPLSAGTNALIRDGAAALVTDGWDVLREYAALYPHKIAYSKAGQVLPAPALSSPQGTPSPAAALNDKQENREKEVDKTTGKAYIDLQEQGASFTDDERKILFHLDRRLLHVDNLIDSAQIPARRVLSALTILEMRGFVRQHEGKRFESLVKLRGADDSGEDMPG